MDTAWFVVNPDHPGYFGGERWWVSGDRLRHAKAYRTQADAEIVSDILSVEYPNVYVQPLMVDMAFWGPRLVDLFRVG